MAFVSLAEFTGENLPPMSPELKLINYIPETRKEKISFLGPRPPAIDGHGLCVMTNLAGVTHPHSKCSGLHLAASDCIHP
jgi:hypothetical protein